MDSRAGESGSSSRAGLRAARFSVQARRRYDFAPRRCVISRSIDVSARERDTYRRVCVGGRREEGDVLRVGGNYANFFFSSEAMLHRRGGGIDGAGNLNFKLGLVGGCFFARDGAM